MSLYTRGDFNKRLAVRLYGWAREALREARYWFNCGEPGYALARLRDAEHWRASARFYRRMP